MPGRTLRSFVFLAACATGMQAQTATDQLIGAAQSGDLATVKRLVESGTDVNSKGFYYQTPIFFAADRGHTDVVRFLLDKGADINHQDSFYKMNALSRAAMRQRIDVIRLLLERGANGAGEIVKQAVYLDNPDMLKVAVDSGKVSASDLTAAISLAEREKKPQMIEAIKTAQISTSKVKTK